jgi:hypothetical protein
MRPLFKYITIFIAIALIASSSYALFLTEPRCSAKPKVDRFDDGEEPTGDEGDDGDNGDGNGNGDDTPWDASHYVFIEEATGSWCQPCVKVGELLAELYESHKYPFYFVSMIGDQDNTREYMENHYNVWGYPSVYVDGGYQILLGGATKKEVLENSIKSALSRNLPPIDINVSAGHNENKTQIRIKGYVKNDGDSTYKGTLRVYLAEIISTQWLDYSKKPYHYGFIEFLIDKNIEIPSNEIHNYSKIIDVQEINIPDDSTLDLDNLMIFSVIFNSKAVKKESDPEDGDFNGNKHEFNAYYADNAAGARVVEGGNLPPSVGIDSPKFGSLNLGGQPIFDFIFLLKKNTVTIGKITIKANVTDDIGIEKVEFYINGNLKFEDTEEPYEYSITKIGIIRNIIPRTHKISIVAYDIEGKTNSAETKVIAFLI